MLAVTQKAHIINLGIWIISITKDMKKKLILKDSNFSVVNKIAILELNRDILKEGNSLILTLIKNVSNDENRFKRINVQKIGSLKDLFNSPINQVFFEVKSDDEVNEISKILNKDGKTVVNINLSSDDKTLIFKLKNSRNIDRKLLNVLRKRQISSTII